MDIKYFGGVNTIGGNKVLVEDQDTKIFLDFGMNFSEHAKYFEEYLRPRTGNGFGDWLALGLLPHPSVLQGIYRNDLLSILGLKESEPEFDAILASHIHYDHTADLSFVHEKIPIFTSEVTIAMAQALIHCSNRTMGTEVFNFVKRNSDGESLKTQERQWNSIETEKKFKIGSLEILPLSVDHSVPGALAFLIYTSEGNVLYSGDMRRHGTHGALTDRMSEIAGNEKIDLFICEGTRLDKTEQQSEQKVQNDSAKVINNSNGLIIADYGFKDITRFETFFEIAKQTKRKFVIGIKDAFLLQKLQGLVEGLPTTKDEQLEIHRTKKMSDPQKPLRPLFEQDNVVTSEEINKKQNEKIVRLSFWELNELIDLQPKTGSQYIHSACEPFNEEMEISQERLNNWLDYFHLQKHQIHCSGHAPQQDIKHIIHAIKPKKLTPIHTVLAKKFSKIVPKQTKVEYAQAQ